MEQFDILVVGSGSGMLVASAAVEQGFKVAVVEHGKMGGTCINVGCVPSKMLIYPADVLATLKDAEKLGIHTTVNSVDFSAIMSRMRALTTHDSGHQAAAVEATPNLKWYKETGEFIDDYTMQVGNQTIKAKTIFIVSGARTLIPPIKGLKDVNYLTSDTVLNLQAPPKSILIVGGGYIGMEYGHFFSALGIKTTILQRLERILPEEEPEISALLHQEMSKRIDIYTSCEAQEAKQDGDQKIIIAKNLKDGTVREFSAETLLIAVGRISNADLLKPQKSGIQLDARGFIKVNEYLETTKKNIYAFGDAIGNQMFKHAANYEAGIAWHNSQHGNKAKMDYSATPHGVFTHPQIASVGLKEAEAEAQKLKFLVGVAQYKDTAMGAALGNPEGFVKVIVDHDTGKILGAHIIGLEASLLIQEITNAMATVGNFGPIAQGMHIHPALNEVVQNAFGNLQHPHEQEHEHEH
jgi:mycothione reductase